MSVASRNGKLRFGVEDDGTRWARLEDLLTADVFGAYRYLPVSVGIGAFLAVAAAADGTTLRAWAEARGVRWETLSRAWVALWPKLAGREPDLVVVLGTAEGEPSLAILIEAKLHAEQHRIGGVSQLGFYGAALLDGGLAEEALEVALPVLRPALLLTADRVKPRAALQIARGELGDGYADGRTDAFWVSWRDAAILAAEALRVRREAGVDPHELAVLEDLVADLAERGFAPPRLRRTFPLPALAPLGAFPWMRVEPTRTRLSTDRKS